MIITRNGITIRIKVADLRVMGRATQGVRLINVSETDDIAAVTKVDRDDEEESITPSDIISENGQSDTPETDSKTDNEENKE